MAEASSSIPLRIAIGHGSSPGEFVVRVLESPAGGRPAATVRAELDALAIRRDPEVGATLFTTFLGGGVATEFRAAVAAAAQRTAELRLELLTASDVGRLPWGALVDPETGHEVTVMLDGVRQARPIVAAPAPAPAPAPTPPPAEVVAPVVEPPVAEPVVELPVVEPVPVDPPVVEPPVVEPVVVEPVVVEPVVVEPVVVEPPLVEPVVQAPVVEPVVVEPPVVEPPVVQAPVVEPPEQPSAPPAGPEFMPVVEFEPLTEAAPAVAADPPPPADEPKPEPPVAVPVPAPEVATTPAPVAAHPPTQPAPASTPAPAASSSRPRVGVVIAIAAGAVLLIGGTAAVIAAVTAGAGRNDAADRDVTTSTAPPTTSEPPEPISVALGVPAAVAWTASGVQCVPGLTLSISASGTVLHEENPASTVTPDGLTDPVFHQYNVDGAPEGSNTVALIGSLDQQKPYFVVGSALDYECPAAGELYLGVNDVGLVGNSGQWDVVIESVD